MAYWRPTRYATKPVVATLGDGINVGLPPFQIGDGEATYSREMDTREYPAASVRPGRSTYALTGSTTPNALGQRANSVLHEIDGNTWRYWNEGTTAWVNLTTTLASTGSRLEDFVTGTYRYTVVMPGKRYWDGTSTAATFGDANTPASAKFTVHKGRVYALDNSTGVAIDFSALNLPNDWTTADDAGSISITNAKGDGTAITTFGDHVIVWTGYSMHELYGTGPFNYELVDVPGNIGCDSDRSVVSSNGRLYWYWHGAIYEYGGGRPRKISTNVDTYLEAIPYAQRSKVAAGATGNHVYFAIPYGSGATQNNLILKYDTLLGRWNAEEGAFVDFTTIGDTLYGVTKDGAIWNMRDPDAVDDAGTPISWSLITKPYNEGAIGEKKILSDMYLIANRSTGSTSFFIGFSTNVENNDSTSFSTLTTSSVAASSNTQNARIMVPTTDLQNVDWYRLRFAGTGQATLHFLQKNLRVRRR